MNSHRRIARRLRDERGEGIVSALMLLSGALIPLIYLVVVFAQVEQGRLAAAQAAQAAVRAAVEAPTAAAAQAAAQQQLADEQGQTRTPLQLQLNGSFARGSVLEADVTGEIPVGNLPFLGNFGTITVHATANAPIDAYRSLNGSDQ
jgi:multidrug efflux pump subunit AcrA (membrane-fusion protein)